MIRRVAAFILMIVIGLLSGQVAHAIIKVKDLESQYGELQGHLKMSEKTVLLFPLAKVNVSHSTGLISVEPIQVIASAPVPRTPADPDIRAIKRKIDRLSAYEQVRYWKLHQIPYPASNVEDELNRALDLVEAIRKQSIEDRQKPMDTPVVAQHSYRRSRSSSSFYYPSYGYNSAYRYRRALRKDTQIELDRIYQPPVAESWNTAMSMADRGRSEALRHVEGGRSAILGNTR